MIVVVLLVTIMGVFTYRQFSNIITGITEETRVDMRLVTAKSLMNDVFEAENNAKTYSLVKDTIYLEKFYEATEKAHNKLEKLYGYSSQKQMLIKDVDSLEKLVTKKFKGLNDFLIFQDKFRVQAALDKVIRNIEKSSSNEEEKGFLYSLFNRNTDAQKIENKLKEEVSVQVISDEIKNIKAEEKNIEAQLKQRELEFLNSDIKINIKINELLNSIEDKELLAINKQTDKAKETMQKTNRQIAIFCVLTALLLTFMTYLIINYIRSNTRYRKALKRAKAKAEDLAETKERFLANMSHELRTPMNAIAGFTEQLSKSNLNSEQEEQLTMVRKSIDHLLYLINDVLDFTKLQAGKLKLEKIGFRPKEFIEDVVTFIKPLAAEKKTKIICNIKTPDKLILLGDPFRLRQVLLNLISNSLKFTENGSVTITLSEIMQNNTGTTIRLEVTDTGIGMSEKQLTKVFQEFEQAEESTSRNYGGTGLGLSIVHMLIKLHNGKVGITSKPNIGTSVIIEIPYGKGSEADITNLERLEGEKNKKISIPKGLKILIVDDEEYNRKLLVTILKRHDSSFTEAINGLEAIKELKSNNYDLVLMDTYMPELDGIKSTAKIRQMKTEVSIIALTAAVTENDRKNYKNAGMNGFVAKPFKENELLSEINRVLNSERVNVSTKQENNPIDDQKRIDFSTLKELSDKDEGFYREMLKTFLSSTSEGISEIEKHFKKEDWKMLAEYSHKICTPAKHLSANTLYYHLKQLEMKCKNEEQLETIQNHIEEVKKEFNFIMADIKVELKK
jgi:signal transduction histidine kinase/DNA-binding NarL/FixJ family response regulator